MTWWDFWSTVVTVLWVDCAYSEVGNPNPVPTGQAHAINFFNHRLEQAFTEWNKIIFFTSLSHVTEVKNDIKPYCRAIPPFQSKKKSFKMKLSIYTYIKHQPLILTANISFQKYFWLITYSNNLY